MIKLPQVFSSGALYQASSSLVVSGTASFRDEIRVSVVAPGGEEIASSSCSAGEGGAFSVSVSTPEASFIRYSLVLSGGGETVRLDDILFGELWLASGQSNMELTNAFIPDADKLYEAVSGKYIRVYNVSYDVPDNLFPWEPKTDQPGRWIGADDAGGLANVSAMGLKFVCDLYSVLNDGREVPVGFLNSSWGGTPITGWLPRDEIEADPAMTEICRRVGTFPDAEKWNTRGEGNFQQPCAQYNLKIAPLTGVKVRGVIWYQGENECGAEYHNRVYADYLRFYHKVYSRRFGADPGSFFMISSLIYPWTYGPSGECSLGYLNDAFVTTAKESPDKFAVIPISHLEPDWAYHKNNHPIHPTNKYCVGEYAARLAMTNVYGADGAKSPSYLRSWRIEGSRIKLDFTDDGGKLHVGAAVGERLRGMYIAGENGVYLPAEYEITGDYTMDIWCGEIPEPKNAAYGIQSMEPKINLFAGDLPAAPFFTDREACLNIEARPWYDCGASSRWASKLHDDVLDLFFRPVFEPLSDSEICPDTAFRRIDAASLRVAGENADFGCFVRSYPYQKLDFEKFSGLRVHLFNTDRLEATLVLVAGDTKLYLPLVREGDLGAGWGVYSAVFPKLDREIDRMEFRFRREAVNYRFVNIEHPRLFF